MSPGTTGDTIGPAAPPAHKPRPSRMVRLLRLLQSALDPRAWAHLVRIVNYYNRTHVQPRRIMQIGPDPHISPTVSFITPERITIGRGVHLNAHSYLWAGPGHARIVLGDYVMFGPGVMAITSGYRFNDGAPMTHQAMDEEDIVIGNDVWVGTGAVILPGARIGDGAIIAAQSVVRGEIPSMAIAAGVPARVVSHRRIKESRDPPHPTAPATGPNRESPTR